MPDPLAPEPVDPRRVKVRWEIARDDSFRRPVRHGHGHTWATPELGHSVHVEPDGLQPDTAHAAAPREHCPGRSIRLYRRLGIGDLVEFDVLDTRQYGSRSEPCGYGTGPACPEVFDPARTMLGAEQEQWLYRRLGRSRARWNVIAQQVPIMRMDVGARPPVELKLDKWDAYPVARRRLLDEWQRRHVANPVVLTGDLHDNWVGDVKADFDDPASATVATEFIGTSISTDGDGVEQTEEGAIALAENAHIHFHNSQRGYVRCPPAA